MGATENVRRLDLQVSARSIQVLAVEKIREAIMLGEFRSGEKLVEVSLCERLGISRPSLREAMRTLEAERLITIIPNRGPMVSVLTWEDALNIYHVRVLLEGEAARLAAVRISADQLDKMATALDEFDLAAGGDDRRAEIEATRAFYDQLLKAADNSIIQDILSSLMARINLLRSRSMSAPGRAIASSAELRAIFTALKEQNAEAAAEAATVHVRNACTSAQRVFAGTG